MQKGSKNNSKQQQQKKHFSIETDQKTKNLFCALNVVPRFAFTLCRGCVLVCLSFSLGFSVSFRPFHSVSLLSQREMILSVDTNWYKLIQTYTRTYKPMEEHTVSHEQLDKRNSIFKSFSFGCARFLLFLCCNCYFSFAFCLHRAPIHIYTSIRNFMSNE